MYLETGLELTGKFLNGFSAEFPEEIVTLIREVDRPFFELTLNEARA